MEADRLARISPAAQTIKYADIIDNTHEIMQHDPHFGRVFSLECQLKLHLMTNGEPALRKSALSTVQTNLAHKRQKHARV
ncbi:MAG: hypothetical protein U5L96_22245 [Owenweeksia sp.]|nr:hypothetical protein [Owenweeksia sp.]